MLLISGSRLKLILQGGAYREIRVWIDGFRDDPLESAVTILNVFVVTALQWVYLCWGSLTVGCALRTIGISPGAQSAPYSR